MKNIWLIEETSLETALRNIPGIIGLRSEEPEQIRMETDAERRRAYYARYNRLRDPMQVDADGVATIEIVGPLMTGATPYEKDMGASDYGDIKKDLAQSLIETAIRSVFINIDSGGGQALGAPELAYLVAQVASVKPVVAWTGSLAASAAFYAVAGATVITASPSAGVGSVGTVAQVVDLTGMLEKFGVKIETFTPDASDLKTTSYSNVPMTDVQRENLKASITATNEKFMSWVSTHRPAVTADSMRGQVFSGEEAARRGLIDAVGSYEDARALALAMAIG